jgi:hypothetical protein
MIAMTMTAGLVGAQPMRGEPEGCPLGNLLLDSGAHKSVSPQDAQPPRHINAQS